MNSGGIQGVPQQEPGAGPRRVLLSRLRSLGDTVLMTPLPAVFKRVSDWEVGVVVESPYDQVLRDNPNVDRLFVIESGASKWGSRLRTMGRIRRFKPSLAIDLHGGTTSALLTAVSGAPRRVGYLQSRNSYLYNHRVPDSRSVWGKDQVHTVEHQLAALKYLGFPVEPIPPTLVPIRPSSLDAVEAKLKQQGLEPGFILIQPAAAFDTKQWESDKFFALADRLVEQGRQVVLTTGPGEEGLLQAAREKCLPQVRVVFPQALSEFAALASRCGLYVGNDTGSTHLVAALQRKVVVIFGSSDFRVWHPWETDHRLLHSDLSCIPCPGYFCLHYAEPHCIRSVSLEAVLKAVLSLL